MPKTYQMNVRLFAVNKRVEGYAWDEIAELVKQEFDLASPPSRRQMTKWVDQHTLPRRVIADGAGSENGDGVNKICREWIRQILYEIDRDLFNVELDCQDERFYLYLQTNPAQSYEKWQALKAKWAERNIKGDIERGQ